MYLYGMDEKECMILFDWAIKFKICVTSPDRSLLERRKAWMDAGGKLPVTEAQALFLKPKVQ